MGIQSVVRMLRAFVLENEAKGLILHRYPDKEALGGRGSATSRRDRSRCAFGRSWVLSQLWPSRWEHARRDRRSGGWLAGVALGCYDRITGNELSLMQNSDCGGNRRKGTIARGDAGATKPRAQNCSAGVPPAMGRCDEAGTSSSCRILQEAELRAGNVGADDLGGERCIDLGFSISWVL